MKLTARDLPLKDLSTRPSDLTEAVYRELEAGETNGRMGIKQWPMTMG